jgi:hypothetical protein
MSASRAPLPDPQALVRRDATMRFAVGCTLAFVLCEGMNWRPTALAPVLTGVLLANLPGRPPLKLGIVVVASMAISSLLVWAVSVLLQQTPTALFIAVGILVFGAFLAMLRGAPGLPLILLLICLAAIPTIVLAFPQEAGALPEKLIKSIVVAMLTVWAVYLPWPRPPLRASPKPPLPPAVEPVHVALTATAIVMPVMLVFLLFEPLQALPVMVCTIFLVTNFDLGHGRRDAIVRVLANMAGAGLGVLAHFVLLAAPSLITVALLSFLLAYGIGALIAEGGARVPALVLANNGCFVIFSSAIAAGASASGVWLARIVYFSLAGLFVVGSMYLVWDRYVQRTQPQPA